MNNLYKLLLFVIGSLFSHYLIAKPAYRGPVLMQQKDGSAVEVYIHGDEHFHYITDSHDNWLKWNNGSLVSTPTLSSEDIEIKRMQSKFFAAQQSTAANGAYLAPRGLVLLVNFSDLSFREENTQAAFDSLLNTHNYTYHGVTGSVRDYFIDQSHGLYAPQFDVYGPLTVNHTMAYYGGNDENENEPRAPLLISDACNAAKEAFNIDFTQYDNDADGYVDFVFVFYAGYGEADGGDANTIWQHMYRLKTNAGINCVIDGKTIDLYACGSELAYYNRTQATNPRDGISTCCHEFSHVCGLPDLYNISKKPTVYTLGSWDLMDYGTTNNHGWTPPSYSAYEKFYCGWLTPTLLNQPCNIELQELGKSNAACIMTTTGTHNLNGTMPNPNTFYMLENRQQNGWDEYLPGHGLLITQVQYSAYSWDANTVNNNRTQRVKLMTADGNTSSNGDDGDTYPGSEQITEFYGIDSFPITNITEIDDIIRFQVMDGGDNIILDSPTFKNQHISICRTVTGIRLENIIGTDDVSIFDANGSLITRQRCSNGTSIDLPQRGIYIIKIGSIIQTLVF